MSELEEVQLMVTSDAGKSGSVKLGHKRTGSTGSAKSASHFNWLITFRNSVLCLYHLFRQAMRPSWSLTISYFYAY